ncbi:glycoside hydrolase family 65 protein [Siccibacter colletis]|uniref:glycoside hydrolase family 65 protein n=1 Tax=Siccibacter colletis TaxID=1505757 RepID=UPI0004E0E8FB|nr:glycosyl hydrolase family 65 protein [Siccibacter colletis]
MNTLTSLIRSRFDPHSLNKEAALMAAGNGYAGIRATHEEDYTLQTRGMFCAGFYHRAGAQETTELVNLPDVVGMQIVINGEVFSLLSGTVLSLRRELHFASGELKRELIWLAPDGQRFAIESRRFLSARQLPCFAQRLSITPLSGPASVSIVTGIDATQTNAGRQHLDEMQVRVFDRRWLQGIYATQDGAHQLAITSHCQVSRAENVRFSAKNRRLMQHISASVERDATFTLEKISWIAVWLDGTGQGSDISKDGLEHLQGCVAQGYDALLEASVAAREMYWRRSRVKVSSRNPEDQQALDFALYQLFAMTPCHDARSSIAAKGLTGEGYKGHVFWDTEVFLLPFFLFTRPGVARQLLRYRWYNLAGAQEKAARSGYDGALFPWESARSGHEETPPFAAINIRTGVRQRVASALAEHHLVADIAWAVVQYYQVTHDGDFMTREGLDLLRETALFWLSRTTEANGRLELHDVIGPDEYTEHVNNNAFTNHMAHYNVAQALHYLRAWQACDAQFEARAEDFLTRLWLPQPDEQGVMAQDDSFMAKPAIDLTRYKAEAGTQAILHDYSRAEVNEMQILKQADVVMLAYLQPGTFTAAQLAANLAFYEPRTIHDSSLSKAIHGIVAARCGDAESSYRFWREGAQIDLGPDPHSCDDGIHAAATGAIWLGAVQGFAGLYVSDGELRLTPCLPEHWQAIDFPLVWQGQPLHFHITHDTVAVSADSRLPLTLWGKPVMVTGQHIFYRRDFCSSEPGSATTEGRA